MSVILDDYTAPARGNDDRLRAVLDMRPPGIDVPARESRRFLARAEVLADCAAAPVACGANQRNVYAVERARKRGVDVRRQHRLYTTGEREHFPRVARPRPGFCRG